MTSNLSIVRNQDVSDLDHLTGEIESFYKQSGVDRCIIYQTGVQTTMVRRVDVGAEPPKELAARLLRIIDQDASSWTKGSHYQVQVFFEGNMLGRIPIERSGAQASGAPLESEPANEAGFLTQTMRHHEAMARVHMGGTRYVMEKLEAENIRLIDRVTGLEKQFLEVKKQEGALMLREVDVDSHRQKAAMRTQMESALWGSIIKSAPSALKALTTQLLGGDASPLAQFKDFVSSISDEEQMMVYAALKPANQAKLVELLGVEENPEPPSGSSPSPSEKES